MQQFELLYMVSEAKETDLDAIKGEITTILTEEGATIREEKRQEFKRKFAYLVKHVVRGTYVIERFDLPETDDFDEGEIPEERQDAIKNINRKLILNQNILRAIVVHADRLPDFKPEEFVKKEDRPKKTMSRGPRRYERPVPRSAKPNVTPKPSPTAKERKTSDENIDDKLEEILNI